MVISADERTYCQAWIQGTWKRKSVASALLDSALIVRCHTCHGPVVLTNTSHDGSRRAHIEHRPTHAGCPITYRFKDGTPFSFHPDAVKDPSEKLSKRKSKTTLQTPPEKTAAVSPPANKIPDEDDRYECPEGKVKFALHKTRERDGAMVKRAKESRLKEKGKLECAVCSIDFVTQYGGHGYGFIEAHHTIPISQMEEDGKQMTKIEDIAFVCSNCHRMLHRSSPLLSIDALKELFFRKVI